MDPDAAPAGPSADALTSAHLVPGAALPAVSQPGLLSAVFAFSPSTPAVKFMLRVKVPSASAYSTSRTKFFLVIEVLPEAPGPAADAEARANTAWLQRCAGNDVAVELDGLRVTAVVTEDGRRNVYCSAAGPRVVCVRGHTKVLRRKSRARTAPAWDFYTPSPGPGPEAARPTRQQMRETSAELSPDARQGTSTAHTTADELPAERYQPVPLAPQRSRSPRPLSAHALQFRSFKRPAEAEPRTSEKRPRFASPPAPASAQPASAQPPQPQAGPSRISIDLAAARTATVAPLRLQPLRAFPHPTSARPLVQAHGQRCKRVEYIDIGTPTGVPPPREGPDRSFLPSPSTYLSSRDTIETPFATQESEVEMVSSQPVPLTQPPQPPPPPHPSLPHEPPQPPPAAPNPYPPPPPLTPARVPPSPHVPTPPHQAGRSRSASAVSDRAARRASLLAELRELEEQERLEQLAEERARAAREADEAAAEHSRRERERELAQREEEQAERRMERERVKEEQEREERERQEQLRWAREREEQLREEERQEVERKRQERERQERERQERERQEGERQERERVKQQRERERQDLERKRREGDCERQELERLAREHEAKRAQEEAERARAAHNVTAALSPKTPRMTTSTDFVAPKSPSVTSTSRTSPPAHVTTSARRAAEERIRRENESRLAQQRRAEDEQATKAANLEAPFLAEKWLYTPLENLPTTGQANAMGVVVEIREPKPTKGRDWALTLILTDPTTHTEGRASVARQVTIMRKREDLASHQFQVGRAVLFRNLRMTGWGGRAKGQIFNDSGSHWYVLCGKKAIPGGQRDVAPITNAETIRLKALETWWSSGGFSAELDTIAGGSKFKTLGEVADRQFFNAVVKILYIRRNPDAGGRQPKYEIYIADGTVNPEATRNFHYVDARIHPRALFCVSFFDNVDEHSESLFKEGNIIRIPNLRVKLYNGALELSWSHLMSDVQHAQGWKARQCSLVDPTDARAIEIEARLKALREAHARGDAAPPQPAPSTTSATTPSKPHPISTALTTSHTDSVSCPRSTLAEVLANTAVPNRFRLLARVAAIHPRNAKGSVRGDLAVLWCRRCNNSFARDFCQSCNDQRRRNAEVRWQMVLELEAGGNDGGGAGDEGEESARLFAVLDGDDAAAVLSPLPPLPGDGPRPNEIARLRKRIATHATFNKDVEDLLLGTEIDGERARPLIDWTVASYAAGKQGELDHLCFRVFGMRKGN